LYIDLQDCIINGFSGVIFHCSNIELKLAQFLAVFMFNAFLIHLLLINVSINHATAAQQLFGHVLHNSLVHSVVIQFQKSLDKFLSILLLIDSVIKLSGLGCGLIEDSNH
jgi:hypothetical protein